MIEAVNSVISNAPLVRGQADQINASRTLVQNEPSVEYVAVEAPKAPYVSPYIHVDNQFDKAVVQIRDSDTGDVVRQFPSESTLQARQRAEIVQQELRSRQEEVRSSGNERETSSAAPQNAARTSIELDIPDVSTASTGGINVAQAQIAAQALARGAQSGQGATSTVSTTA